MRDYDGYVAGRLPALRRSAFLLCGDWDRGDDLVQRVLTELYLRWSGAQRADNLDALVRTIMVRRFLDERRSGWSRRVHLVDPDRAPDRPAPPGEDPAQRLDVRAALASLPPGQRAVVVLRFLDDLSVEETARVLGCTAGTVKSQTSRALATLRVVLGEDLAEQSLERRPS